MNIVFRVDSSYQIGSGHLIRCLSLAQQLKSTNNISFICKNLDKNLSFLVKEKGFKLFLIKKTSSYNNDKLFHSSWLHSTQNEDANQCIEILKKEAIDLLILDHYALDYRFEKQISPFVKKLMIIDDLADRKHHCNILLDQNYYKNYKQRYDKLVPSKCLKFLGTKNILLRNEFFQVKRKIRTGQVNNIFVFLGGIDKQNITNKVIQALKDFKFSEVNIVIGAMNTQKNKLIEACQKYNFHYHFNINYIAELMAKADFAIGAGGATTWERAYLGLPSICISIAHNQIQTAQDSNEKFLIYLGHYDKVDEAIIKNSITNLIQNPKKLTKLSKKLFILCSRI